MLSADAFWEDYAALAAVHTESQAWDQIDPLSARESVPTAAALAATFPLDELRSSPDLLLVTIAEHVVGYVDVCWRWTDVYGCG